MGFKKWAGGTPVACTGLICGLRPRARLVNSPKNNNKFAAAMAGKKALRSAVFHFYQIHKDKGKAYTVSHFKGQGYARPYLYRLIKQFEDRGTDQMDLSKDQKDLTKDQETLIDNLVEDQMDLFKDLCLHF